MKKNKENRPVYLFIGYRLTEVSLNRITNDSLDSFGIKLIESEYNEENELYIITSQFNMEFENNDESYFIFDAAFQINDTNWLSSMTKKQINSLLFSSVFPYIRQKIHSLTDDYRGSVDIPTMDLRQVDLSDGVTFELKD